MGRAFRAAGVAVKDLFEDFGILIVCNMVWALMSVPLLALMGLMLASGSLFWGGVVALLAVLPMGPATAGLYTVCLRVSEGRASKIGDFFAGVRQHAVQSWKVLGIWVAGLIIIIVDIQFYAGFSNFLGNLILGLWLWLLVFWLAVLVYLFPLMLLQTTPGLRTLARNATLMSVGRPIFSFITLVLMGLVLAILLIFNIWPLLLPIFVVAWLAQWSTRATQALIKEQEERRAAQEAAANPTSVVDEKGRRGQVRPK